EAGRLETEANVLHTKASDAWAFFQAKKIRTSETRQLLALVPLVAREPEGEAASQLRKEWTALADRYESDAPGELKDLERQAEALVKEAEAKHAAAAAL